MEHLCDESVGKLQVHIVRRGSANYDSSVQVIKSAVAAAAVVAVAAVLILRAVFQWKTENVNVIPDSYFEQVDCESRDSERLTIPLQSSERGAERLVVRQRGWWWRKRSWMYECSIRYSNSLSLLHSPVDCTGAAWCRDFPLLCSVASWFSVMAKCTRLLRSKSQTTMCGTWKRSN